MQSDRYIWDDATFRKRNHLPHVDVPGGLYFITFCLADAIPRGFVEQLGRERARTLAQVRERFGTVRPVDIRQVSKWMRNEIFEEMDRGRGRCDLARPAIAELVTESLFHFHQERYQLLSHAIMPNHVHLIFQPAPEWPWWKCVGSLKSFTGRRANRILGRSGPFWQDDNYDTLIRSPQHLETATKYVLDNPAKAGLQDWPWYGYTSGGWGSSPDSRGAPAPRKEEQGETVGTNEPGRDK